MSVPTKLFDAAASGDASHARGLLAAYPEIVNAHDADGDGAAPRGRSSRSDVRPHGFLGVGDGGSASNRRRNV